MKTISKKQYQLITISSVLILIFLSIAVFRVIKTNNIETITNREAAKTTISFLSKVMDIFYKDCGRFPTDSEGLEALRFAPADLVSLWKGPYINNNKLYDPWKNRYLYVAGSDPNNSDYKILSYGADGMPGGEGNNADIYNTD